MQYVVNRWFDAIGMMERTTGRTFDDQKMIQAMENEFRSTGLWAEICTLNKARPAPMEEKSMHSFSVLATLNEASKEVADLCKAIRDEMKDRIDRKHAPGQHGQRAGVRPRAVFHRIGSFMENLGLERLG